MFDNNNKYYKLLNMNNTRKNKINIETEFYMNRIPLEI